MTVTSLRRARWPMSTTLFVAIVAIVAIVGVGCSDPTSDRLQPSARGTTAARGGPLIGLWADFYAALDASDTDWVTAIPVTLRNNSLTPILIRDVRFEQTVGLDVADVRMIGPQDQALGNAMYLGWLTPTLGGVGNPDLSLETRQLAGYVIPPHSAEQAGANPNVPSDQEGDASPVFKLRRSDRVAKAIGKGLVVEYSEGGEPLTARFPDSQVIICDPAVVADGRCEPDGD